MKILLISPIPPPAGGIATWTELYLNSKIAKENEVDLINIAVTGKRVGNFVKINVVDEIKRALNISNKVKKYIKKNNYDIVHLNTSCSRLGIFRDYVCALIIKRNNIKLVLHCHCDTEYMVKGKILKVMFKRLCRLSDKILVLNNNSKKHVKSLTRKESFVIPNFFDVSKYKNVSKKLTTRKIKDIIYVGHIVKSKGCGEIIEVAKVMPEVNFILIGFLSEEINKLKITKNVKFLGEVSKDKVIEYMSNSDLLLFPSHTEGFPNVVLEAMACGLPVVATNVGAIPDMLENKGGIIVKVNNIPEIIDAINTIESSKLRESISKWSKEKVAKNYTLDKVTEIIIKQYKELSR